MATRDSAGEPIECYRRVFRRALTHAILWPATSSPRRAEVPATVVVLDRTISVGDRQTPPSTGQRAIAFESSAPLGGGFEANSNCRGLLVARRSKSQVMALRRFLRAGGLDVAGLGSALRRQTGDAGCGSEELAPGHSSRGELGAAMFP